MSPGSRQGASSVATWDSAAYSAAEAARLVGVRPSRVRRWLRGYQYAYQDEIKVQGPVVQRRGTVGTTYASFLDLVDLLFVKQFLDHGVSLQKLRKALDEATEVLGTPHFARRSFFTDGSQIFLEVQEEGEAILELLSGGQWVIAPIIKELAEQIQFHSPTGLARRWYPMGPDGLVVLDPLIAFGQPTIVGRGITTANVFDFYQGEDGRFAAVSSWLDLKRVEVEAAVTFEERLAA